MANKKIVLLAGSGFSTDVVYNALQQQYDLSAVIIEAPVDKKTFLTRRIKKLGFFTVAGQVLFQAMIVPVLNAFSKKRKAQIIQENNLDDRPIPSEKIKNVSSVNSDETLLLLKEIDPDLVIVNGTRIIAKKILNAVPCKFINTHTGITPAYRGVHGTYWALVNKDEANSGVTVHLVDAGIDTGGILYQARVTTNKKDNFTTYPILQLAAGVPLLLQASNDALENNLTEIEGTSSSKLWYHPTAWQYLYNRIFRNVK